MDINAQSRRQGHAQSSLEGRAGIAQELMLELSILPRPLDQIAQFHSLTPHLGRPRPAYVCVAAIAVTSRACKSAYTAMAARMRPT
jgi:hypothetical protein